MGNLFGNLLDAVAVTVGSDAVNSDPVTQPEAPVKRARPSIKPLVVFVTPSYKNEPINNAMLGELGAMQTIAHMTDPQGQSVVDIARWIPNGPHDVEGRLVLIDPLAGTRNNAGLAEDIGQRELHVRTDIDRVIAVIVRFPCSEALFAQVQTVFCTYGRPQLIADFSNAGLYMDMKFGPSAKERAEYGGSSLTRPYSLEVLRQFDTVRVPTQKISDMIQRELRGAA